MPQQGSLPSHCPGFQTFRQLSSFICKCPECGKEKEIFSDEFDRPQVCSGCGRQIDFTQCTIDGSVVRNDPR